MKETINQVAAQIKAKIGDYRPKIGIILGSGLGGMAEAIENPVIIPYEEIEGFPRSTVSGHAGRLVIGKLNGVDVLCMQGRVHFYEGHSPASLALVIRSYKKVGIEKMILTNAAGSLNSDMGPGSLMVISDHINLSGCNPLIGPNDEEFGPRFPDMTYAYDPELRKKMIEAAEKEGVNMYMGVYLMRSGPNFETPRRNHDVQNVGRQCGRHVDRFGNSVRHSLRHESRRRVRHYELRRRNGQRKTNPRRNAGAGK